ncbi:MAG: dihydroorotase [Verrucomicrobiota bacterium]
MSALAIRDVLIINEGTRTEGDVLFRDGRIAQIGGEVSLPEGGREINGSGKWLLPGVIDDQVHFRDYELSHKATIATESRAAAAGGVTSYMEMPNTKPPTTSWQAWREKTALGARDSVVNYAFYMGATNENAEEALHNIPEGDICGLKIFMGSSTGNMLVDHSEVLERFYRDWPGLIATHCEDEATVRQSLAEAQERYPDGIPADAHPIVRNHDACYKSSSMAIEMARKFNTRLHILHLTTAREIGQFSNGPLTDKRITSEVCVHHLTFTQEDYAELGFQIKCNPAIKSAEDRDALWQGLADGRIDVIATDHAPHTWDEKQTVDYNKAPAGLPLIQHPLGLMLAHAEAGRITVEDCVKFMSHRVADCYRMVDRGYLREGYWADAVLVDPQQKPEVCKAELKYKCGWSPLEGRKLGGEITHTFVNGEVVYQTGDVVCETAAQPLKFLPYR